MKSYNFYVYILSNYKRTVLYIGLTNNLNRRIQEHKQKRNPGFTAKYNVFFLMYYEHFCYVREAIAREKQLKGWTRAKKMNLIKMNNPELRDLYLNSSLR